jgi:beta-mannosidase
MGTTPADAAASRPLGDLDLGGTWRALEADDVLRRSFADPDLDDDGWDALPVPGHWRSTSAFADSDGPLLQRRRFVARPPDGGMRAWLVLDGLFYQGDVWLDGGYLGDTEGYFVRHTFEVTRALRTQHEHTLAVEVTCAPQLNPTGKRNLTGVLQPGPEWNPGGIWRPVRVEHTGPVRARSLRVLCREATPERAVVALRAELDSDAARSVCLRTRVAGAEDMALRSVAEGANFVDWTIAVDRPRLWWPHALGDQPLEDVVVEVEVAGVVSHELTRRVGLRSLAWRDFVLSVNGERLFLKGSGLGPTRRALSDATPEELRADVARAREAGLDLVRVQGHVTRPELYEAADELGVLVWQDLPLQGGYARGIRPQAVRQAAAAVDHLGHHPSVAVWCGHDEPVPTGGATPAAAPRDLVRLALAHQLPSWNRTVLDRSIRRELERADPTRPVLPHSGVLPSPGSGGTDAHLSLGWRHGDERDLPALLRAVPRLARFVSGFGAQAVPEAAGFMDPARWPDLDWPRLVRAHGLELEVFERVVPPGASPTFEAWRSATQSHQAAVVRHHVEHLRRLKYRPTGGFCHLLLADGHPAVSASLLDHERRPKEALAALAAACRPVVVVADRPPAVVVPGDDLHLDVHVVSDLREPLAAEVVARLAWAGDERSWRWTGEVDADAVARVGTVAAMVPDEPGPLVLTVSLRAPGHVVDNRYLARISP